jgi:molecular chaperone Hsp33
MTETLSDQPLRFTIPGRHVRGRIVRLEGVLGEILSAHAYPPPLRMILAEALTLAALLGSLLKEAGGQLTMQVQNQGGVVQWLVVDYHEGAVRGYAQFDHDRLDELGPNPSLHALFGDAWLAITFDQETSGERYQGIVPLEGESLSDACQYYFVQSEQIPTFIRIAIGERNGHPVAAGILLQHLPEGEEGRERLHVRLDHPEWEHVAVMASSLRADELLNPELSMDVLVWRLFHEESEVRVEPGTTLRKGCRCSVEHFHSVISRFPPDDRKDMVGDDGNITVDCAFCSRKFALEPF